MSTKNNWADTMDSEQVLCPSSRCQDGAILLGIVLPNGQVALSSERLVIDEEFVRIAHEGRAPEKRFRFASPCVKAGCQQWSGERCGVIDSVMESVGTQSDEMSLPDCSIRSACRWFRQSGGAACAVCPEVITDLRVDAEIAA
jgi:hypothetical protein